jgi:pimeloyl-ACP methyl ester carboxylesterase
MIHSYHNGVAEPRIGHWASPKAQRRFEALYADVEPELWKALCDAGWPAPPIECDVETRCGTTHVFEWPGTGPPIVLLHGAGTSSVMWVPLLATLVGRHVYAIDTPGQPGRSVQRAPIPDGDALVAWLDDTLDGLRLEHPHLVGASYGGWIALSYARHVPTRPATISLVEPVLTKVGASFFVHGFLVLLAMATPGALRRRWLRRLHMEFVVTTDARFRTLARLGLTRYRPGTPRPVPFTDADLAAVETPVLVLLGAESELHDAKKLAVRVQACMPDATVELVPDAGHALPTDHAELVGTRLRAFLDAR